MAGAGATWLHNSIPVPEVSEGMAKKGIGGRGGIRQRLSGDVMRLGSQCSEARCGCGCERQARRLQVRVEALPGEQESDAADSIIESRETVADFASLSQEGLDAAIDQRRQRVFLLLEEVRLDVLHPTLALAHSQYTTHNTCMLHYDAQIRRLRIAQMVRNRAKESDVQTHDRNHQFRSAIPLLPPLTRASLRSACSPLFTLRALSTLFT